MSQLGAGPFWAFNYNYNYKLHLPVGQGWKTVADAAPASAQMPPLRHETQPLMPSSSVYLPGAHAEQLVDAADGEKDPGLHFQHSSTAGVAPFVYLPTLHSAQCSPLPATPTWSWNLPPGQMEQTSLPVARCCPGAHGARQRLELGKPPVVV